MKKLCLVALLVTMVTSLAGCDDDDKGTVNNTPIQPPVAATQPVEYIQDQQPTQVIQAAPQPPQTVIVQSPQSHSSGIGDFATGMLIGNMMSSGNNVREVHHYNDSGYNRNRNYNTNTKTVINKTTVVNNYSTQPRSVSSKPSTITSTSTVKSRNVDTQKYKNIFNKSSVRSTTTYKHSISSHRRNRR